VERQQGSDAVAITGDSQTGTAVQGITTTGVALSAFTNSPQAVGLRVQGRVQLPSVSGVETIVAGGSSVLVTPHIPITPETVVMLTPCSNLGGRSFWYVLKQDPNEGVFAIWISSSVDTDVQIAWLLIG
jgi:hypothetical protein